MPYVEFHRWVLAAVLAMARIGGAFAICPALAESMVPGVARRAFVLAVSVIALPWIKATMPPGEPSLWMFAYLGFREAVIGFFIGFFAAMPFWIAENVGNFIDNQRGATMGEVYSPLNGSQVSTTGLFFTQLVSTVFFAGGAILVFLGAVFSSYSIWPVFSRALSFTRNAPIEALGALDGLVRSAVVISAPIIIVMFLATLGLGLVNRTAPQLNVFFLSMPVKSALGIAMLVVYLPFIMDMLIYTKEPEILEPVRRIIDS